MGNAGLIMRVSGTTPVRTDSYGSGVLAAWTHNEQPTWIGDQAPKVAVLRSTMLPTDPIALAPAAPPSSFDAVAAALRPKDLPLLVSLRDRNLLTLTDRHGVPLIESLRRIAESPLQTPDPVREKALCDAAAAAKDRVDTWLATTEKPYTDPQKTELKHLQDVAKKAGVQPFALSTAAYRAEVLGALLSHYQDPVTNLNQGDFGTCAPAIAQRHMIEEDPADYASLVAGLFVDGTASEGGTAYTLNRENLIRVGADNPAVDADARDWVNMAVQSTLIDTETPGTYDKVTENMARPDEVAHGVPQGRGLSSEGRVALQTKLLDGTFSFLDTEDAATKTDTNPAIPALKAELIKAEARRQDALAHPGTAYPSPDFVEIRINWGTAKAPGSHAVGVIEATDDRVFISNPQGNLYGYYKGRYPVVQDAERHMNYIDLATSTTKPAGMRVYENGITSFPWETMQKHLWGVYVRTR